MELIDAASLPSQTEMDEIATLATYTGASVAQLMHFRSTVLRAAAEKQRAEGLYQAADLIDPGRASR